MKRAYSWLRLAEKIHPLLTTGFFGALPMAFEVEATYVNGMLKLDKPLPLQENERLTIRIVPKKSRVDEFCGRLGWTGDPEILRKIAEDDDIMEYE